MSTLPPPRFHRPRRHADAARSGRLGLPLAAAFAALSLPTFAQDEPQTMATSHPYVGMWVTDDGHIRHELLPPDRHGVGRYDEARGRRQSAYQGRYTITGHHIDYVDDTGFTADGEFIDDVLHHAGMVLRRETPRAGDGER